MMDASLKIRLVTLIAAALSACSVPSERRALTNSEFARAKQACAAPDAYLLYGEERGVAFHGVSPSPSLRAKQATCLAARLKEFDVKFIGFVSVGSR